MLLKCSATHLDLTLDTVVRRLAIAEELGHRVARINAKAHAEHREPVRDAQDDGEGGGTKSPSAHTFAKRTTLRMCGYERTTCRDGAAVSMKYCRSQTTTPGVEGRGYGCCCGWPPRGRRWWGSWRLRPGYRGSLTGPCC